jgi:hypothetical protein
MTLEQWKLADIKPGKRTIKRILADWEWQERRLRSYNYDLEEKIKRLRRQLESSRQQVIHPTEDKT